MTWSLAGAFAAAVAYGAATILQARGARDGNAPADLDMRLVNRLARSVPYVLGLALDGVGFLLALAALRDLALFVVQSIVAASLAVTALLAVLVLGSRLRLREWLAVAVVITGLGLLASTARTDHASPLSFAERLALLGGVVLVAALAALAIRADRLPASSRTAALGALAGTLYGAAGICAHVLAVPTTWWDIVLDPAAWAMVVAGAMGAVINALALQGGSVTTATAAVVVSETLVPALIGVVALGDRPAHGMTALAIAGFSLAVVGAVTLARHGESSLPADRSEVPAHDVAHSPTG